MEIRGLRGAVFHGGAAVVIGAGAFSGIDAGDHAAQEVSARLLASSMLFTPVMVWYTVFAWLEWRAAGGRWLAVRVCALAGGGFAAVAFVTRHYRWWFEMSAHDKGTYDVQLQLVEILVRGAFILVLSYLALTVGALVVSSRRPAGPVVWGGVRGPAVARRRAALSVDLAVLSAPPLAATAFDGDRFALGPAAAIQLTALMVAISVLSALPRPREAAQVGSPVREGR